MERFSQTFNNYVPHENKIRKNINPQDFLRYAKQEFPCLSLESFSREYYNMGNKILGFHCGLVCTKQTRPNYSVGSDQDEAEIQYDRLSAQEQCNCEKYEKMPTSLECMCCLKIPKVKTFHLNVKQDSPGIQLLWNFLQNLWNLTVNESF